MNKQIKSWLMDFEENNNSIDKLTLTFFKNSIINILFNFFNETISESIKIWINKKLNDRFKEIYDAYSITENKFKYRKRDNWELYITHINWVLEIYLELFFNLEERLKNLDNTKENDRKKAIQFVKNELSILWTIIEHDSIEDTDSTMEWINERFTNNKLVAFSTLLLSKPNFYHYINNEEDKKEFEYIKSTWILNNKLQISDRIKNKIKMSNDILEEDLIKYTVWDDYKLTNIEIDAIKRYKKLEKIYKSIRNQKYFNNYTSIKSLKKYAREKQKEKNLKFNNDDFNIIIYITIIVKLSDRINNLNDITEAWEENPNKIEKKLQETEKYLLPIAKEFDILFNTQIMECLKTIIFSIRKKIIDKTTNNKKDLVLEN